MAKKPVEDVFGLWLLKNAFYDGKYEMPIIYGTSTIPEKIILFSKRHNEEDKSNKAIHFYELDENFVEELGSQELLNQEIKTFKQYQSVILPDFSVYRDFPLGMQIEQVFKSRAIGNYLIQNGINVIPNIRWADERSYEFAFLGIKKNSVISIGIQGGYRDNQCKYYFEKGFYKMLETLEPKMILCYGNLKDNLKKACEKIGTKYKEFPTEISTRYDKSKRRNDNQLYLFDL